MTRIQSSCLICDRLMLWHQGQNPFFIYEFEHSIFVLGDHQFHRGYSLLLLKQHVRELHELAPLIQTALFQEVMTATAAIVQTFHPWKMNHACYGNSEPHIHWHLFPRYSQDRDRHTHPWLHSTEFRNHQTDPLTTKATIEQIRANLNQIVEQNNQE